jgi:hypothetical protein
MQLVRGVLIGVLVLCAGMLLHLLVASRLQHTATQERAFDSLREQLALGTAPIGPSDSDGDPLDLGTPIFELQIPSLGVNEVVFEGKKVAVGKLVGLIVDDASKLPFLGKSAADEALADRRTFVLSGEKWDAFVAALDAPPADNPALKKLLARPDIFARP